MQYNSDSFILMKSDMKEIIDFFLMLLVSITLCYFLWALVENHLILCLSARSELQSKASETHVRYHSFSTCATFSEKLTFFTPWYAIFYQLLVIPQSTLGHSRGDSITNPMLITEFAQFKLKGHPEHCNEVGSLSLALGLLGF